MAISSNLLRLGTVTFGVSTKAYDSLERMDTYSWATAERVGRRPAKQFVGMGDSTVSLSGTVYPTFQPSGSGAMVGVNQLDDIRAMAEEGSPQMLVSGTGKVLGLWVIDSVRETQTVLLENGNPRKQGFTISLSRYGRDSQ